MSPLLKGEGLALVGGGRVHGSPHSLRARLIPRMSPVASDSVHPSSPGR